MDGRRILKEFFPPVVVRAIGGLLAVPRAGSPSRHGRVGVLPLGVPEGGPKGLNYVNGDPVILVPLSRLRYPDGRRYTVEEHHFLQYYVAGLPALRRFYALHQPRNVFEAHGLPTPAGAFPPTEVPWFAAYAPTEFRGEGGLGPEHGDQAFGPVSERKLLLEAARLDAVLASIRKDGFRPDRGGHPKGYFMLRRGGAWVFAIREGFHRVAAMAFLGYDPIEVVFTPRMPRFVEEGDAAAWPMVAAGVMAEHDALALFARYFRDGPSAESACGPRPRHGGPPRGHDDQRGSSATYR